MSLIKIFTFSRILFPFLISGLGILSFAQEAAEPPRDFVGVVQFAKGKVSRGENENLAFKSLLRFQDKIQLASDAQLKIITNERCVGVFYGPSVLHSPQNANDRLWKQDSGSSRWICPEGQEQLYAHSGSVFRIFSGELTLHRNKVLVRKAKVTTLSGELPVGVLLSQDQGVWQLEVSQDDLEVWEFNNHLPLPKESLPVGKRPQREYFSRFSVGPTFGFVDINHESSDLELKDARLNGARFQFERKSDLDHHWLFSLTWQDTENRKAKDAPGGDPQSYSWSDPNLFNRLEQWTFDIGHRFKAQRRFSPVARLGLGNLKHQINTSVPNSYGLNYEVEYLNLSLAAGVDTNLFLNSLPWLGLQISSEIFYQRTLFHLKTRNRMHWDNNGLGPSDKTLRGWIQQLGILVRVGPAFQF